MKSVGADPCVGPGADTRVRPYNGMYKKLKIHFVGIGGVGMSGIAEVLLNLGYPVSGSDLKKTTVTARLKRKGAELYYGHRRSNLGNVSVVVVSSAVNFQNPEVLEAQKKNIPIIQRAEMLAELMRFSRFGIAVSGTHGKTTTTSLVASVLHKGGMDPTVIIGGKVNSMRSNARLGKGEFMVAEADESDGSFLKLSPTLAVITNIDREHMDYYGTFERVKQVYLDFTQKLPFYGTVICCIDHPVVRELIPKIQKRIVTYGITEGAMITARNIVARREQMHFDLFIQGKRWGKIRLNLMGRHNVLNALASLSVAYELQISLKKAAGALENFAGIHRRMEVLLKTKELTVLDDYGHHPEEIKATLATIREAYPEKRLFVFFQPHRYSRTKDLFQEMTRSFDAAHAVVLTDIYSAGEKVIPGVNSKKIVSLIRKRGKDAQYLPKNNHLIDEIVKRVKPGDVVLSLGAGDITKLGREVAKKLKETKTI